MAKASSQNMPSVKKHLEDSLLHQGVLRLNSKRVNTEEQFRNDFLNKLTGILENVLRGTIKSEEQINKEKLDDVIKQCQDFYNEHVRPYDFKFIPDYFESFLDDAIYASIEPTVYYVAFRLGWKTTAQVTVTPVPVPVPAPAPVTTAAPTGSAPKLSTGKSSASPDNAPPSGIETNPRDKGYNG